MVVSQGLEVQLAVSKIGKYATGESGDSVEVIERPRGGLSIVLVDGQRSGRAAKLISNIAARKIVSLLADGVRDGAAARAAHDYLRTMRQGTVSAEVAITSFDLVSKTIVISRNTRCPAIVARSGPENAIQIWALDAPSEPIGIHERTKPVISEMAMEAGLSLVLFSDGVMSSGCRYGRSFDSVAFIREFLEGQRGTVVELADSIRAQATELDAGRPEDDISVIAVQISTNTGSALVRKMAIRFPF